jgi:molybdopterin/thiamine biosynthesis adenylyltransferase
MLIDDENKLYMRHPTSITKIPKEVFVVGCGGTGTWCSILSAMMGSEVIHLADDDHIEISNLSRLPFDLDNSVGKKKTEVLKAFIKRIRPECEVNTYDGLHTQASLLRIRGDVLYDCNDNFNVQKMVYEYCKRKGIRYIGVGCNAEHISITSSLDGGLWGENTVNQYTITPMFIVPAVLASLVGVWTNICNPHTEVDLLLNINKMFNEVLIPGVLPHSCINCPVQESCPPCQEHSKEKYSPCTHCPISPVGNPS